MTWNRVSANEERERQSDVRRSSGLPGQAYSRLGQLGFEKSCTGCAEKQLLSGFGVTHKSLFSELNGSE